MEEYTSIISIGGFKIRIPVMADHPANARLDCREIMAKIFPSVPYRVLLTTPSRILKS